MISLCNLVQVWFYYNTRVSLKNVYHKTDLYKNLKSTPWNKTDLVFIGMLAYLLVVIINVKNFNIKQIFIKAYLKQKQILETYLFTEVGI